MPEAPESLMFSSKEKPRSFVGELLRNGTILTAFAFLAGHFYLEAYLLAFNVSIDTLDLPFFAIVMGVVPYSLGLFPKLANLGMFVFASALLILLAKRSRQFIEKAWASWLSRKSDVSKQPLLGLNRAIATFGALLVLYFAGVVLCVVIPVKLATKRADRDMKEPSEYIRLFFKKGEENLFGSELCEANRSGTLVLIAGTKDLVAVRIASATKNPAFVISRSNLVSVEQGITAESRALGNTCNSATP